MLLKVNKYQKIFFLKFHCPKKQQILTYEASLFFEQRSFKKKCVGDLEKGLFLKLHKDFDHVVYTKSEDFCLLMISPFDSDVIVSSEGGGDCPFTSPFKVFVCNWLLHHHVQFPRKSDNYKQAIYQMIQIIYDGIYIKNLAITTPFDGTMFFFG